MIHSNKHKLLFSEEYKQYFCKNNHTKVIRMRGKKISSYLNLNLENHKTQNLTNEKFCLNSSDSVLKHIQINEANFSILDEGLISTYPTNKLLSHFKIIYKSIVNPKLLNATFPHTSAKIIYFYELSDPNEKISPQVMICIPCLNSNEIKTNISKLTDEFIKYGYYMSNYDINQQSDFSLVYITFEAKYSNMLVNLEPVLYHVSPLKYLNKILKNGLIPASKSIEFNYSPRVYLFNKCSRDLVYAYGMNKTQQSKDIGFCVFKVFKDKLLNDQIFKNGIQKFYLDPAFSMTDNYTDQTAIYTYNNIPKRLLSKYYAVCKVDSEYKKILSAETKILI